MQGHGMRETQYKLSYKKLNGTRGEKIYPTLDRLNRAVAKTKTANPTHEMEETITPVEVEVWQAPPLIPMSRAEREYGMMQERNERALERINRGR